MAEVRNLKNNNPSNPVCCSFSCYLRRFGKVKTLEDIKPEDKSPKMVRDFAGSCMQGTLSLHAQTSSIDIAALISRFRILP